MDTELDRIAVRLDTAARLVDTSPETLKRWIKEGRLPAVKLGRGWRVRIEDLKALLDAVPA